MRKSESSECVKVVEYAQATKMYSIVISTWGTWSTWVSLVMEDQLEEKVPSEIFLCTAPEKQLSQQAVPAGYRRPSELYHIVREKGFFNQITDHDIGKVLGELNFNGKSVEPDNLHTLVLKEVGHKLLLPLFFRVLEEKEWPFSIAEDNFIPKPGKDSYVATGSIEPINKLSYIGKILERIVRNRITSQLPENNLEDTSQKIFR